MLLGGGTLAQQLLRWDARATNAVSAAIGAGVVALVISEFGWVLRERSERRRMTSVNADGTDVMLLVRDGQVVDAYGNTERTLGVDPDTAVGLLLHEVVATIEPARLDEVFNHALGQRDRGAKVTGLALREQNRANGDRRYVDVAVRDKSHDRAIRAYVVTVSDATDRTQAQRALAVAASVDGETLLPNRERLVELLDMTLHRARRKGDHVAVLTVGIDRHGSIVEGFDESAQRAIMTEVARRVRSTVRMEDPVGRVSADQFAVILGGLEPRIGRAFALDVADRISRSVGDPLEVSGSRLTLAVSVGAAHRAQGSPEPSPHELLGEAEESLSQVRANTNRWKDTTPA